MVTSDEIEEQIAKMHNEGKTSKYISGVVHKNLSKDATIPKLMEEMKACSSRREQRS